MKDWTVMINGSDLDKAKSLTDRPIIMGDVKNTINDLMCYERFVDSRLTYSCIDNILIPPRLMLALSASA